MSNFPRLDETGLTYLVNKLAEKIRPNKNVQSDWNESDSTSDAYIKNKQVITNQVQDMNNVLGAKNLLPFPYYENRSSINGITYIKNSDGSVTFNGTATANVYFNCTFVYKIVDFGNTGFSSRGKSYALYKAVLGNGGDNVFLDYNATNKITAIVITKGTMCENLTVYPMICLVSIEDDTYVPYAKTNRELTEDTTALLDNTEVNGAVNMLPTTATTRTLNGVTFTVNDDGSVTANGTVTGNSTTWFYLFGTYDAPVMLPNIVGKTVKLTGCPSGGGVGVYLIRFFEVTPTTIVHSDFGNGDTFTVQDNLTGCTCAIGIAQGVTVSNLTFKPMLTVASYNGDYVPYAKSNKKLTDDIKEINSQLGSIDYDGAGAHNSIYRGKYLGAAVTAAQYTAISSGKFTDLYIGDYWTIGGVNYRIGAFDYWYRTGDTECKAHHVLIVPDTNLVSGKMNDTNTTEGGYVGSDLKTGNNSNTTLATAKNKINNAFGSSHILTHREYFTNAVANGKPSAGTWYDSDIDLMNENMVYGTNIFLPHSDGSTVPTLYTIDKTQIKLFAERPDLITIRANWWLRDIVSAAAFALVDGYGAATPYNASYSFGVRPAFAIKG